jgi:hypothetical protein
MRRLPAYVNACDADTTGKPRGRAREREAEHDCGEGGKRGKNRRALPKQPTLDARPTTPPGPDQGIFAPRRQGREV